MTAPLATPLQGGANSLPLRDIHLPDAVSWWPPAPGWWLLLLLVIALLILIPRLLAYLRQPKANKLALKEFQRIKARFQQQQNPQQLARDLSALLRRVGLSYYSRQQIASLTGKAWARQLNQINPQQPLSADLIDKLSQAAYQPAPELDSHNLLNSCEHWLKQLPGKRP